EYIKSISDESIKPVDTSRMSDINKLEKALAICESTEINSLVIDVKNDDGLVAWNSEIEIVNKIKSNWSVPLKNYERLMDYLDENEIYTIARVVAFKDPYFAEIKNEHAIQLKKGGVYKDDSGKTWVNPFDEYVWKYLVAISKEAALRGFDEIQYDYVRFPARAAYYNPITEFPGRNGRDKDEAIEEFLKYANLELKPYNVHVSADVFGVITRSWDDKPEDIGQTWRKIANEVDYICPMIYPSHYGPGIYGYSVPDQEPYGVVRSALIESIERNAAQRKPGIIRPWFQGFTAPWIKGNINYDAKAISDQMVASMELGMDEYIIWNASNNYDPMSFFYRDRMNTNIRKSGEDILSRTPEITLIKYLEAEQRERYSHLYLLTPINEREEDYDKFTLSLNKKHLILKNYDIVNINKSDDGGYIALVNVEYVSNMGSANIKEAEFKIILENDVYKVIKPKLEWITE
ncbi:MAG TPA: putative glycoside hydrolase, partial [Clostridia bacterium]|nr:putative glycoside hydrolase [Clostridia bacterium]